MVLFLTSINSISIVAWGGAYLYRDWNFPLICGFESIWENRFLNTRDADIERSRPPENWGSSDDRHVGKVIFFSGRYPGLEIQEPYPDWTGFDFFGFEVFSEMDTTLNLTVRIEDFYHNDEYADRFNRTFIIEPGFNKISIPLDEIRLAL